MLNWFLDFSYKTNFILNTFMFSLIGIAYIVVGYVWDHKVYKVLMMLCGSFLIVMNFLPGDLIVNIIGIACIITPLLIARFTDKKSGLASQEKLN